MFQFARLLIVFAPVVACSSEDTFSSTPSPTAGVSADTTEIVQGVPDRGRDPSVLAIDIAREGLCSGTLIAPNLVLTARHCVSRTAEQVHCPAGAPVLSNRAASSLEFYAGEQASHGKRVAVGKELILPEIGDLCGNDLAFVLLDRSVAGVPIARVRSAAPAVGERIRAVGFGRSGDDGSFGSKLLRDHVRILALSKDEFEVGEATCQGDSGGPALDESTGEILGVVSRGGPLCDAGPGVEVHNIYTRVDSHRAILQRALQRATKDLGSTKSPDGGSPDLSTPKATRPVSDVGESCLKASDCAAGVCIRDTSGGYCSRPCGGGDRCPAHYHCGKVSGSSVCLAVP